MRLHQNQPEVKSILEGIRQQNKESKLVNHVDIIHLDSIPDGSNDQSQATIGCDIEIYIKFSSVDSVALVQGMSANHVCLDAHIELENCKFNKDKQGYEWIGNELIVNEDIHLFYGSGCNPSNSVWCNTDLLEVNDIIDNESSSIAKDIIIDIFSSMSLSEKTIFRQVFIDKTISEARLQVA